MGYLTGLRVHRFATGGCHNDLYRLLASLHREVHRYCTIVIELIALLARSGESLTLDSDVIVTGL